MSINTIIIDMYGVIIRSEPGISSLMFTASLVKLNMRVSTNLYMRIGCLPKQAMERYHQMTSSQLWDLMIPNMQ